MTQTLARFLVVTLGAAGLSGQTTTVSVTLNGAGGAFGVPTSITGTLSTVTFTVVTASGSAQIPLSSAAIGGSASGSDLVLVPAGSTSDLLYFHDNNPGETSNGRAGTATVGSGSGAFQGATGSLNYVFTCTEGCYTGTGPIIPGTFNFTLTASGTLSLPTAAVEAVLPSIVPALGDAYDGGGGTGGSILVLCYNADLSANGNVISYDGGGGSGGGVYRLGPNPNGNAVSDTSPPADGGGGAGAGICPADGGGGTGNGIYRPGPNPNAAGASCDKGGGAIGGLRPGNSIASRANAVSDTSTFDGGGGIGVCPYDGGGGGGVGIYRPGPNPNAAATSSSTAGASLVITPPRQAVSSTFTASATCPGSTTGCWITVPTTSGTIPAFTSSPIALDFNIGTVPGVFPATFSYTLTPAGGTPVNKNVPFTLLVGNGAPNLQLSETGIQFPGVSAGQPSLYAHMISLASSGAAIPYTATGSTLTGGSWLTVSPASGSVSASTSSLPTTVNIQANPAGLAAGSYFGRVDFSAPSASKPLQSVEVELTVPAATAPIVSAPILSTNGVIFVTGQGKNPEPQSITVSSLSSTPVAAAGQAASDLLPNWLTASNYSITLQSGKPVTETLTVLYQNPAPGVYSGTFYAVSASGAFSEATVLLIVTPPVCTPTRLLSVFTNLGTGFEFPAGLPVSVQAEVVDDCGNPLNSGAVQVSFSNGDSGATMTAVGDGQWVGTWKPHGITGGVVSIGISAQSTTGLAGSASAAGTLDANTIPVVTPGGIVSAANPVSGAPLSPGAFISIYGSNLATAQTSSGSYPFKTSLSGTRVLLGGMALPLQFVGPGLINALVPFEIPVNGVQQLIVEQNGMYSLPETVVVATASPAVFTQNESGQGLGVIVVYQADGSAFETNPNQFASAGDTLVIYCTGLGPVNPAVPDGAAAPLSPLSNTVNPVTVTVGGMPAKVGFAGLTPTLAGLYQVNVTVPTGVAAGANVPVIVTTSGFSSAPVTVAIQ